jgi:hypothetical protein
VTGQVRRAGGLIASAAACAAALAACGSGGNHHNKTAGKVSSDVEFAQCVRSHGYSKFPDPGGAFPSAGGGELFPTIPGFNPTSPVFKRDAAACGLKGSIGQPHGG